MMKWTLEALEILARHESVPGIALRDALFEIKKLQKEKEMSKTVKIGDDGHVSLEDEQYPTAEEADKILKDAGYDLEQVKLQGKIFMKVLFENLELKDLLRDYDEALNMLLPLVPVNMMVDPVDPKHTAQLILDGVKKNG